MQRPPLCPPPALWRLMHALRTSCTLAHTLSLCVLSSHVILPKHIAKTAPKGRLLNDTEWRGIGVQQSRGWVHYSIHRCHHPLSHHRSLVACAIWSHTLSELAPHLPPPGLSRTSCSSADRTAPTRRQAWWPASALIPTPAR